jgi:hypothetical protein
MEGVGCRADGYPASLVILLTAEFYAARVGAPAPPQPRPPRRGGHFVLRRVLKIAWWWRPADIRHDR